jgi:hypothetical protein
MGGVSGAPSREAGVLVVGLGTEIVLYGDYLQQRHLGVVDAQGVQSDLGGQVAAVQLGVLP